MTTFIVILVILSILVGMAISVYAFGTGGKRANVFKDIYFSIEDVDGIGVIYTKTGEFSAVLRIENPVQKYSADVESYYAFTSLMTNILQTLGDGYALHKQDIFVRKRFDMQKVAARRDPNVDKAVSTSPKAISVSSMAVSTQTARHMLSLLRRTKRVPC